MLIVIYRSEYYQMMETYKNVKRELMKLLDPYTLICSGTKMFVGPDIKIDFRCEFIGNMAGLIPNYYNAVDSDSYKFLLQAAAKVNGRHATISEILDIIKDYIENHRVKEMQNEQVKSCANCAYCEMTTFDFPCNICMDTGRHEYWKPKKEKTLVGDITTGYRYVDTDKLVQASTTGLPMGQYALEALKIAQEKDIMSKSVSAVLDAHKTAQEKDILNSTFGILIEKENKTMPPKMNYRDLYINGNLFGGLSNVPSEKPTVKDITILEGVTTLVWSDGDVTIVTQGPDDAFDSEKAIAMAVSKKFLGTNKSKSNYIEEIHRLEEMAIDKYVKRQEKAAKKEMKKAAKKEITENFDQYMNPPVEPEVIDMPIKEFAEKAGVTVETIRRQCIKGQYPGAKKVAGKWYIPVKKEG